MMQVLEIVNWICFALVLAVAMYQDIKTRKIKNEVNVAGVALGLFFAVLLPERQLLPAIIGFLVMLAVGMLCWICKFFRAGDAKLLCAVGAFVEWKMGLNILLIAVVCGAVIGLPFIIKRIMKKEKGLTKFPFSIAIGLACAIGLIFGYVWELINFM